VRAGSPAREREVLSISRFPRGAPRERPSTCSASPANEISIDEALGQTLALLWVPHTVLAFDAPFFVFRMLDVLEPLGAREIQKRPGGRGVVADDVVAGIYSWGVLHGLRVVLAHIGHRLLG
jgi:hypothetical protein